MGVFGTLKNIMKPGRSKIKRTLRRAGIEDMSASNFSSVTDAKRYIHDLKRQKKSRKKSRRERKSEKETELTADIRLRLNALGFQTMGYSGHALKSLAGVSKETIDNPNELFASFQAAVHELTAIVNNDPEARISKYSSKLDAAQKAKAKAEADTHIDRTLLNIFIDKMGVVEKKLTDNEKVYAQRWKELDTQKEMLLKGYRDCSDTSKREFVNELTASLDNARLNQDTAQFQQYLETLRPIVDECSSTGTKFANNLARIEMFLDKVKRFKKKNPKCEKMADILKPSIEALEDMADEMKRSKQVNDQLLNDTFLQAESVFAATYAECTKISTDDIAQASPVWTYAAYGAGALAAGTGLAMATGLVAPATVAATGYAVGNGIYNYGGYALNAVRSLGSWWSGAAPTKAELDALEADELAKHDAFLKLKKGDPNYDAAEKAWQAAFQKFTDGEKRFYAAEEAAKAAAAAAAAAPPAPPGMLQIAPPPAAAPAAPAAPGAAAAAAAAAVPGAAAPPGAQPGAKPGTWWDTAGNLYESGVGLINQASVAKNYWDQGTRLWRSFRGTGGRTRKRRSPKKGRRTPRGYLQ
jgi:hypothetical protein